MRPRGLMSRYRKVDKRTWSDEKYRNLSSPPPCGKHLWLYLITGPHTGPIPGLFRAGEAAMAEDLGWPLEGFREAFREVSSKGMAKADWEAKLVWLPKALKYNKPASPNVVKSWANEWDELPECALRNQAFQAIKAFLEGFGEGFRKAFGKACANQEQEQEQEQDIYNRPVCEPDGSRLNPDQVDQAPNEPSPKEARDDIQEVWQHYRTHHPKATKVLRSTRKVYRLIKAALADYTVDEIKAAIDGYHRSPWHTGENPSGQKYLGLDLIVRSADHIQRGLEMGDPKNNGSGGRSSRSVLDHPLVTGDIEH